MGSGCEESLKNTLRTLQLYRFRTRARLNRFIESLVRRILGAHVPCLLYSPSGAVTCRHSQSRHRCTRSARTRPLTYFPTSIEIQVFHLHFYDSRTGGQPETSAL